MGFLPDTNVIVALTRHGDRQVERHFAAHRSDILLSAIVFHELCYGAFSSDRAEHHLATLAELPFATLAFEAEDARAAAEVRAVLRRAGTPVGPYDVLIAGQALARDLTVVTANTREFARVAGLRVADWTSG